MLGSAAAGSLLAVAGFSFFNRGSIIMMEDELWEGAAPW